MLRWLYLRLYFQFCPILHLKDFWKVHILNSKFNLYFLFMNLCASNWICLQSIPCLCAMYSHLNFSKTAFSQEISKVCILLSVLLHSKFEKLRDSDFVWEVWSRNQIEKTVRFYNTSFRTVNIVRVVVKVFMNPLKLFVIVTKIIEISTTVSYFYW